MSTRVKLYRNLVVLAVCCWQMSAALALDETAWRPYREVQLPAVRMTDAIEPVQHVVQEPMVACPTEMVCPPAVISSGQGYCAPNVCMPAPMTMAPQMMVPMAAAAAGPEVWDWHLLPGDLIWHSYWAGAKEPRMSGAAFYESNSSLSLLDVTLGGRTSVLRYGSIKNPTPEGWELQLEGAALLRLNLEEDWDFEASDYRFGVPLVYGWDRWQYKISYYHLSSHLGDEYMERNATLDRINFSRDVLVAAVSFFPRPAWRWYAEMGWAFYIDGGTKPWEFQFGVDYAQPGPTGCQGRPFFAVNGHLREEVDFGGNLSAQAGWFWRGESANVLRTGVHYYNGKSNQFQFFDEFEQQIGLGLWYDY